MFGHLLQPQLKRILVPTTFVHVPELEQQPLIHLHLLVMTTSVKLVRQLHTAGGLLLMTPFLMAKDVDQQAPAVHLTTHHGLPNSFPQPPPTT